MKKLLFSIAVIAFVASSSCLNSRPKSKKDQFLGDWKGEGKNDTSKFVIKKLAADFVIDDKKNGSMMPITYDSTKNTFAFYHNAGFSTDTAIISYIESSDQLIIKGQGEMLEFERGK